MKTAGMKFVALLAIIGLAPLSFMLGGIAAIFLIQQVVSGWIPSQWFSDSGLDWAFGGGTKGGASNYFGFMLSAMPSYLCGLGVKWGYETLRKSPE
jgi:hypothetical protein